MCVRPLAVAAFALLFLGAPVAVRSEDTSYLWNSLKGVRAVKIVVESIPPEIEQAGLTTSQLRADVQLRLQQSSIHVDEGAVTSALYVNVNAILNQESLLYAYGARVEFMQPVVVKRIALTTGGTTWSAGTIGFADRDKLSSSARQAVGDLTDEFVNAFLSANPKLQ